MNFIYISICIILIAISIYFLRKNIYEPFDSQFPKIAVITAIYGNYDNLKIQKINHKDKVDWYCFTDNKNISSDFWKIITTPYHIQNNRDTYKKYKNNYNNINEKKIYNMMCAKYYKAKTHEIDILSDYDYYIWIDGSIILRPNFISNIIDIIQKNDYPNLIQFKHSERDNIKDEVKLSVTMDKYKTQDLQKQYDQYKKDGYPDSNGLFENTIIIKKKDDSINWLFDEWWIHNLQYSYQDQISLPYLMWKLRIFPDYIINENVFNNQQFSYVDFKLMRNH